MTPLNKKLLMYGGGAFAVTIVLYLEKKKPLKVKQQLLHQR